MPNTVITDLVCEMKYIKRNILKINFWVKSSEPIYDAWLHSVFYFRFNRMTYQKFPIDLWENICSWCNNSAKSFMLDWSFGKILQYSNVHHACPYVYVYLKVDNISMSHFSIEQLLPAGRFRVDHNITSGNRKEVLFSVQMFLSVSDNRIELF